MTQRIAILGAGANGAAIGTDLTRAGLDVKLIDQWPAHVEAMRANGVTVKMPTRRSAPTSMPITCVISPPSRNPSTSCLCCSRPTTRAGRPN
ncbi:MAG: hypothetical protein CMM26_08095 [Rhodospirillaceae bacterium]|nr:hypothetical protein [Rhodospirillaceae bacterium]